MLATGEILIGFSVAPIAYIQLISAHSLHILGWAGDDIRVYFDSRWMRMATYMFGMGFDANKLDSVYRTDYRGVDTGKLIIGQFSPRV